MFKIIFNVLYNYITYNILYNRFIIYRPSARGIRRNITLTNDISRAAFIPKVKEPTNSHKFRINFKICQILTERIQFLIFYVYLGF
jgi:hypothetical protein